MAEIIVASTIVGNVIIVWLMLWRGWSGRLQWLVLMSALAVPVEALFYYVHGISHWLYAPLRLVVQYWIFPVLMLICGWEAHWVNVRWLEKLMLIQVGLAAIAGFAHFHGDKTAVYWIEIFNCWFNVAGIILCIIKFKGEPRYEPRQA